MYTGNIEPARPSATIATVYPCVYREHRMETIRQWRLSGLSLCIQGTFHYLIVIMCIFRFIPVYTGNIPLAANDVALIAVYPCVYREHTVVVSLSSSAVRFIPVYTGNINSSIIYLPFNTVYPCVYREHIS